MGPGGIAVIILAAAVAVIAVAIAYAVVRVGRLVDQASKSLQEITLETVPLLDEVTTTVTLVNGPLHAINKVSKNIEEVSGRLTAATTDFADKNSTAMKVAGGLLSLVQLSKGKSSTKRSKKRSGEQE